MKKKQYISPLLEITDLRVKGATMQSPLFGPASMPNDDFNAAPRKRTEVF